LAGTSSDLEIVGDVAKALADLGLEPILVGGMALVLLGSRRVTMDFDFVIARPEHRLPSVVDVFYDREFELAARVNENGDITSTIDNARVAAARIRLDAPESVFFYNRKTGLRIDLLFDYPLAAAVLAEQATKTKIRSHTLRVASESDLLCLKKIAQAKRRSPGDAQDIAFLEARQKRQ
jgi:hypothetical protein